MLIMKILVSLKGFDAVCDDVAFVTVVIVFALLVPL